MFSSKQLVLKVILLGSSNVGKTSILNRYVRNIFYDNSKPTVGVDFLSKPLTRDEISTPSSPRLRKLVSAPSGAVSNGSGSTAAASNGEFRKSGINPINASGQTSSSFLQPNKS